VSRRNKNFSGGLAVASACALVAQVATAQTVHRQTVARLPSVPAHSVELDRHRAAANWNSRFCSRWTDECARCFKPHGLSIDAVCEPVKDDPACSPSAVRCLEFDAVIAPLFCTGLHDGCGGSGLTVSDRGDDFFPASNYECHARQVRPPVNWTCGTAKTTRDHCLETAHTGGQSMKECLQSGLHVLRQYRRAMQRLVRDSKRHDLR
jgi:hypothetical protein